MKAALFYGGRDIRVEELPDPLPGPGDVLIDIGAAGVCGSDLHPYRGASPWGDQSPGPRRAGHELAGTIAALGSGVTTLYTGQRVGIEPMHLVGCGACRQCRRGDYHVCPRRGLREDGQRRSSAGFSELDLAVAENVFPLPDHVSLEAASLLDVYGCAIHALNRIPLRLTDYVCVVGTGPIGLTMGQVARAAGVKKVIMVGRRDPLLEFAIRVGAADLVVNNTKVLIGEAIADLTDGEFCDAVFETVGGTADTVEQAVEAAAFGGKIGIIGAFWNDVAVAYRAANRKEIDLRWCNSYATWNGVREYQIALDLVAEGRVQAEPLITHRYPLSEITEAFAAADDKRASGAVKVIVQP
jgi:2-desacetyl-2-hydroxyethyl bacteriochlorophyllide A dehydrogenase